MRILLSVANFISEWSGKIFSYLWIVATLVAVQEVIRRYVLHIPTFWGLELTIYLCAIVYMMGAAYTLYHRKHISIDIIYSRFSQRARAILDLITFPLFCLFTGLLMWTGAERTVRAIMLGEGSGSAWNPPIWPILIMIPVGASLMLLQGLAKFIEDLVIVVGRKTQ
jgi:TRAP-type mannitol/chloroaromatic compound transport system permease small subunit